MSGLLQVRGPPFDLDALQPCLAGDERDQELPPPTYLVRQPEAAAMYLRDPMSQVCGPIRRRAEDGFSRSINLTESSLLEADGELPPRNSNSGLNIRSFESVA